MGSRLLMRRLIERFVELADQNQMGNKSEILEIVGE